MGSGGSGGGNPFSKYVIPGVETAAGAASEFFAPGNPIGLAAMGSGIGQLSGGAAGGSQGQAMGGDIGSMLGGMGGGMMPGGGLGSGMGMPGVSDSAITDMLGSMNPGAGANLGGPAASGGGKGTGGGGASGGLGQLGGFLQNKQFQDLIGQQGLDLQGMLKPKKQDDSRPPSINPGKGGGAPAGITTPQEPLQAPGGVRGSSASDPRIQAILARLMRQR